MPHLTFRVIDSHTAGEPTRTIVDCELELPSTHMQDRLEAIRTQYDHLRTAIVNEPRGSEVMVGAHLLPPCDPQNTASVVFFNNVGYLGMCGHGMIGVVETLRTLGRIEPGVHTFETIAGLVKAELLTDRSVRIRNVPSYRLAKGIEIQTKDHGVIQGDIAYGGNWFFLAKHELMETLSPAPEELLSVAIDILESCRADHPQVDHIELVGPPKDNRSSGRNFVLCPGNMYDRSPCGTGTSAKLACLAADGELLPGQIWIQEGILGTSFEATYQWFDSDCEQIVPTIRGRAFVNGEVRVIVDSEDPFGWGFSR